ncbi:MAG: NitrOD5 domain-containing protein [Candidatus Bathyarchaeia archaeon]
MKKKGSRLENDAASDDVLKRLLIESIDESMNALGETVKATIIFILKKRFMIDVEGVIEKPERFVYALRSILGSRGSQILEELILTKLYSKLGLKYEKDENKEFAEYIEDARRKTQRTQKPKQSARFFKQDSNTKTMIENSQNL